MKHAASGISEDSTRRAVDEIWETLAGNVYEKDIGHALRLARQFDDSSGDSSDKEEVLRLFSLPQGPQDRILVADLIDKMQPRVELIRQALFGTDSAPFPGREEAAEWIRQTAEKENPRKHPRFGHCSCGNMVVFVSALRKLGHRTSWLEYEQPMASSLRVNKVLTVFVPGEPNRLARLDDFAKQHAPIVGCSSEALTTWVLSDIEPVIGPATFRISQTTPWEGSPHMWRIPARQQARLPQLPTKLSVTIEFNTADITDAQLRVIRGLVKETLNLTKKKPLTKKDEKLLRAVKQLGGVPSAHGEKGKFWIEVSNRLKDQDLDLSPDTVRIQFGRIEERKRKRRDALQQLEKD